MALRPASTYNTCVTKLSGHFAESCIDGLFEQVHHYVADLRGLAILCKFGALEDELIMDQLDEHTNNPKVRKNVPRQPNSGVRPWK